MKQLRKRCSRCGELKPFSDYYVEGRSGRRTAHCKGCEKQRGAKRYATKRTEVLSRCKDYYYEMRQKAIEIYGGYCVVCESTQQLELDHVHNDGNIHRQIEQPRLMYIRIAKFGKKLPDYRLRLVCRTCHRKKTNHFQNLSRKQAA